MEIEKHGPMYRLKPPSKFFRRNYKLNFSYTFTWLLVPYVLKRVLGDRGNGDEAFGDFHPPGLQHNQTKNQKFQILKYFFDSSL